MKPASEARGALHWLGLPLRWLAIGLVRAYQLVLSPILHGLAGSGFGCRFAPTCSQYALECLRTLPLGKALYLSIRRILRCHPWGGSGYDPPPKRLEKKK